MAGTRMKDIESIITINMTEPDLDLIFKRPLDWRNIGAMSRKNRPRASLPSKFDRLIFKRGQIIIIDKNKADR